MGPRHQHPGHQSQEPGPLLSFSFPIFTNTASPMLPRLFPSTRQTQGPRGRVPHRQDLGQGAGRGPRVSMDSGSPSTPPTFALGTSLHPKMGPTQWVWMRTVGPELQQFPSLLSLLSLVPMVAKGAGAISSVSQMRKSTHIMHVPGPRLPTHGLLGPHPQPGHTLQWTSQREHKAGHLPPAGSLGHHRDRLTRKGP